MDGIVKWFSKEKGYGFIAVPGADDSYFHVSQVKGSELPNNGDTVTFEPTTGRNGKSSATNVLITSRKSLKPEVPYYGKPTYYTHVAKTEGNRLASAGVLGTIGAIIGGPIGAVIGATAGGIFGRKESEKITEYEITSPCLKCGGIGQVTAQSGGYTGFQCKTCKSFWKSRG